MAENPKNDIITITINTLLHDGVVPKTGYFDITEHMIDEYISTYDSWKQKLNPNNTTTKVGKSRIGFRFARKLAGLSLLRIKNERGIPFSKCKEGILYRISNPSWPNFLKIGISYDVVKRLSSYQTYSPLRDYKIEGYDFLLDKKGAEKYLLSKYQIDSDLGEWISKDKSDYILSDIKEKFLGYSSTGRASGR